ncbi:MAG: ribonuclease Z [Nanoarchaeota archaeon]|nr:ribonuclease Z [Nanoarchaeota archaeon]
MAEKIKLFFLGTSGAIPTADRNHTSILLTYGGENILIDCGEGTQRQFRKAKLNPCKLTKILITHWHGDHVLGLPGLMQTLAFSEYQKGLTIYGPKGTKKYLANMFKTFAFVNKFPIKVVEVTKEGVFFENGDFYIEARKMFHNVPCNAYSFIQKGERRVDKKKLKSSGLPPGPLLQKLKQGKDVVFKGKKYESKDLTFEEEGKKVSFVLDTKLNKNIVPFVKNADVLVCEATFEHGKEELARGRYHLTSGQAAEIAKRADVKRLILTHISQRYEKNTEPVLKEATKIFKKSSLIDDLYWVQV